MDRLPFELYFPIIRHLDLNDLIQVRAVCRKFRDAVQDFKIRELVMLSRHQRRTRGNWIHTVQPYDLSYSISNEERFRRLVDACIINFSFLKRAKVNWLSELLNDFRKLEHLEVECDLYSKNANFKLALPELKTFRVERSCYQFPAPFVAELETPKLRDVFFGFDAVLEYFKFNYPLAVAYLRTTYFFEGIAEFRNLETFEIFYCKDLKIDFLVNLPRLTAVKVLMRKPYSLEFELPKLDELKRANFRLYHLGIELLVGDELDEESEDTLIEISNGILNAELNQTRRTRFYLKYYELMDDYLPNCSALLYDVLPENIEKQEKFFRKFNIQSLQVSRPVENQDRLVRLIDAC